MKVGTLPPRSRVFSAGTRFTHRRAPRAGASGNRAFPSRSATPDAATRRARSFAPHHNPGIPRATGAGADGPKGRMIPFRNAFRPRHRRKGRYFL